MPVWLDVLAFARPCSRRWPRLPMPSPAAASSSVSAPAGMTRSTRHSATRPTTGSPVSRTPSASLGRSCAGERDRQRSLSRGRRRCTPAAVRAAHPTPRRRHGPRMLQLTARYADAWNTTWFRLSDERLRRRVADLDAALENEGRDPATIRRTVGRRDRRQTSHERERWRRAASGHDRQPRQRRRVHGARVRRPDRPTRANERALARPPGHGAPTPGSL